MKRSLLIVVSVALLMAAGLGAYTLGQRVGGSASSEIVGTEFENPVDVTNVSLKTAGDAEVSLAEYKDKVTLVFFGFTRCPDVCPIVLSNLAEMTKALGEPDDLEVLMITVDPEFDTPDITHNYASGYHEDFVGLSGSNSEVAEVMQQFFIAAGKNAEGAIFHTDVVFILNRDASIKYLYGPDKLDQLPANVETLMASNSW